MDKKKRSLNDRETELRQDKENLIKIVDLEENHLKTLEKALELVSNLTDPEEPLNLDKAAEVIATHIYVPFTTCFPTKCFRFP